MKILKTLLLLTSISLLCSCDPDDNSCSCEDIKGKRYYMNLPTSYFNQCTFADDIEYRKDGFINLYRTGGGYDNKLMEKVCKYSFDSNCKVKFYNLDKSKILNEPSCSTFSLSIMYAFEGLSETTLPFTVITCNSYNIGAITHLDYNPR